jgi:hypothetical protein
MSNLLNFTVYCQTAQKTLLPWRIASLTPPDATFRSFFQNFVVPKVQEDGKDLVATYIGRGKEKLDAVDSDLGVAEVVSLFGPFVKYMVEDVDQAMTDTTGILCSSLL